MNPIEKRKKTDRRKMRDDKQNRRPVVTGVFGVFGISCILYCGGIAVAGFGSYFFLIWGGLGIVNLFLSSILGNKKRTAAIPKWVKVICGSVFGLGLLIFCLIEGMILTKYNSQGKPNADFCIILGAQWKSDGPSQVLRKRLDKAIEYLNANPDTKVIVSGGKGGNEPISEALGMQGYLIDAGIAKDRILMEDASSNTYENLVFSSKFLDPENDDVIIVTNNFHVFRALSIAKKQGYANADGLAAKSVMGMAPNNLLREFMGVIKDFMVGNL